MTACVTCVLCCQRERKEACDFDCLLQADCLFSIACWCVVTCVQSQWRDDEVCLPAMLVFALAAVYPHCLPLYDPFCLGILRWLAGGRMERRVVHTYLPTIHYHHHLTTTIPSCLPTLSFPTLLYYGFGSIFRQVGVVWFVANNFSAYAHCAHARAYRARVAHGWRISITP